MSEAYKSALEKIRAKYEKTETVSDDYGRVIVVRRLDTPQQLAVRGMAGGSDDTVIGVLTLGASVVSIDEIPFPFPSTRKELDSTLYVLDEAGIKAMSTAYERFSTTEQGMIDAAKNLPPTSG